MSRCVLGWGMLRGEASKTRMLSAWSQPSHTLCSRETSLFVVEPSLLPRAFTPLCHHLPMHHHRPLPTPQADKNEEQDFLIYNWQPLYTGRHESGKEEQDFQQIYVFDGVKAAGQHGGSGVKQLLQRLLSWA